MAPGRTRDAIAALEQARAQIATVLAGNADWLALDGAAGSSRIALELALAANPLYRSWKLLGEAIRDLRAQEAQQAPAEPRPTEDEPPAAGLVGAPAGAGAGTHDLLRPVALMDPRSVDLHHVLQYIRDTAVRAGDTAAPAGEPPGGAPAPAATASDDADGRGAAAPAEQEDDTSPEAADATPDWEDGGDLAPELEEATVTFVIREAAPPASADADAAKDGVPDGPLSDQWAAVGAEDGLYAPTDGEVEEAEVVIVSRHSDRRARKA